MLVRLIPIGNVHAKIIEAVVEGLRAQVNVRAKILPSMPVPRETFNQWRKQYNAEQMMALLTKQNAATFINKEVPTLFVTDVDIYYNGLNFVFGLEDPVLATSIVSVARLRPEFYDQSPNLFLVTERAAKEAIHEIGHRLGFEHCGHKFCVMSFSPSIGDVDEKKNEFCSSCRIKASMKGIEV